MVNLNPHFALQAAVIVPKTVDERISICIKVQRQLKRQNFYRTIFQILIQQAKLAAIETAKIS